MPRSTNPENNPDAFCITSVGHDVKAAVLSTVAEAASKITSIDLQRLLYKKFRYPNRTVRDAVKELIDEGELNYINVAGRTLIEKAFNRPVRVSRRIVLAPAGMGGSDNKDTVTLFIRQGAAFGDGRHPTTRLALMGIEVVIDDLLGEPSVVTGSVLDIGTGSGVLLIAALRLGFGNGVGVDIDPCAVSEAAANVALNRLTARAEISGQGFETLETKFGLICANLRWPTLKSARDQMIDRLKPDGVLVLSGIKAAEENTLIDWYAMAGFTCRWRSSQNDWAAVVLQITD